MEIYERACHEAVEAARAAGERINRHAGRLGTGAIREKGAHDLVTVLDEEVQELVVGRLKAAFPEHEFLAEEGEMAKSSGEAAEAFRWIIDPIDGTTNFSRGAPPYAVSIGLQQKGQMVVGVIYEPSRDEMYTAVRGRGAHLNGERIRVSSTDSLEQSLIATGFPYRAIEHLPAYLDVLGSFIKRCHGFRRLGSAAIDLAYVAAGRYDGFYETGLSAWDMAAGTVLIEEAGGRITGYDGGAHSLFGNHIVASNGRVHDDILELVAPLRESLERDTK